MVVIFNKELRVIELFSGVGSQTQALKNINVPHKVVVVSEIDSFADKSYRALHGDGVRNLGDITKIAALPEADFWTYSFPCQDLSVASQTRLGLRGARSGLLYEVERLLWTAKEQQRLPKFLLLENVKNLVGKNHKADFEKWLAFLKSLGYMNSWDILNAKDYIPQNRERVFCVSVLDGKVPYEFPLVPIRTSKLKDYMDTDVSSKYYLKLSAVEKKLSTGFLSWRNCVQTKDYSQTLAARDYKRPASIISGELKLENMLDTGVKEKYYITVGEFNHMLKTGYCQDRRKVQTKDYCKALVACDSKRPACIITGNIESAVWDMLVRLTDIKNGGIPLPPEDEPIIIAQRGRNPYNPSDRTAGVPTKQRLEYNRKGVCNTLTTVCKDNLVCNIEWDSVKTYTLKEIYNGLRIRKMTEREYWRLMGWKDTEIDKVIAAGVSASQMYRQAGNGIVVPVLEAIFSKLFKGQYLNT